MPTVLILIFTLFIMVTVIPYAFSNVIKQLQAVRLLEQQQGKKFAYNYLVSAIIVFTLMIAIFRGSSCCRGRNVDLEWGLGRSDSISDQLEVMTSLRSDQERL